jgi:hypothetical protein
MSYPSPPCHKLDPLCLELDPLCPDPPCLEPDPWSGLARMGPTLPCKEDAYRRQARLGVAPTRLCCFLPKDLPHWARVWNVVEAVGHRSWRAARGRPRPRTLVACCVCMKISRSSWDHSTLLEISPPTTNT